MGAASMLIRIHGDHAMSFANKRICALTAVGDVGGAAMWKKVANCINQLSGTGSSN
jgi:hypothetical protein